MKNKTRAFPYLLLLVGILGPLFLIHGIILKDRAIFLPDETIYGIAVDSQDRIWARTLDGVIMVKNEASKFYELNNQFLIVGGRAFRFILVDEQDHIWVIASTGDRKNSEGAFSFDGKDWVFQGIVILEQENWTYQFQDKSICCLPDNKVGTDTNINSMEIEGILMSNLNDNINTMAKDTQGNIWAGTDTGLKRLSSTFTPLPLPLVALHLFLSTGGYWILGFTITIFYCLYLIRTDEMFSSKVKAFISTKGRVILGVGCFILLSFLIFTTIMIFVFGGCGFPGC